MKVGWHNDNVDSDEGESNEDDGDKDDIDCDGEKSFSLSSLYTWFTNWLI